MRHGIKTKKLNRTSSHRNAMFANMAIALFKHEQIKTTLPKAKALRPIVEKLITSARDSSLATIRSLMAKLGDKVIVDKLMKDIAVRSANRPGGYTRIYKMGYRFGDMAPMALIELVDKPAVAEKEKPKKAKAKKSTEAAETSSATEKAVENNEEQAS